MNSTPNVLVIMSDQLTASRCGCYGIRVTQVSAHRAPGRAGVVFDALLQQPALHPLALLHDDRPAAVPPAATTTPPISPARSRPSRTTLRAPGYRTVLSRQDAFRRPRPAARLRGAADHRHLSGRLRLDARLAQARRAHRLVVSQHGERHRRRRRRDHQPAANTTTRSASTPCARCTTLARADDRRPFLLRRQLHPSARPLRRPGRQYWDRYEGVDIPLPGRSAADVDRSTRTRSGCAASCDMDEARPSATTTCAARAAPTSATSPTSTTGSASCSQTLERSGWRTTPWWSCSPTTATCWASAGSGTR